MYVVSGPIGSGTGSSRPRLWDTVGWLLTTAQCGQDGWTTKRRNMIRAIAFLTSCAYPVINFGADGLSLV